MQVFHPYKSALKSIQCLDNSRMGKQRLECIQILLANNNIDTEWEVPKSVPPHKNVVLWKNYSGYLFYYLGILLNEWEDRGMKNFVCRGMYEKLRNIYGLQENTKRPRFIDNKFIQTQRLSLLNKKMEHYYKFFGKDLL